MDNAWTKRDLTQSLLAGGLAAFALGGADAVRCKVGFGETATLALRGGAVGLLLGFVQILWILSKQKWGVKRTGLAVIIFICLPWSLWLCFHLAQTATLRSLLPFPIIVAGGVLPIAAALWFVLSVHSRYLESAKKTPALLGMLFATLFMFVSTQTIDLHAPIAVTALLLTWLSLQPITRMATGLFFKRWSQLLTVGLGVLSITAFVLPVGIEGAFVAMENGILIRYMAVVGSREKLSTVDSSSVLQALSKSVDASSTPVSLPHLPGRSIVMISIDALRSDHLGFMGYQRNVSPNIDALAASSIVFERAYSASPSSSLSIPSLQAGRFMEPVLRSKVPLPPTLADRLRAKGYATIGLYPDKVFSAGPTLMGEIEKTAFGFEQRHILVRDAHKDAKTAVEFLSKETRHPLYLWVHFYDPHLPYDCHDNPFGDKPMDCYDAEIKYTDTELGFFLDKVNTILENPIIALTADHGEAFGEHGRFYHSTDLHREQIQVPLIIHAPGLSPATISVPVSNVALADTLEALVDNVAPKNTAHAGLLPVIASASSTKAMVTASLKNKRVLITPNYKLMCNGWPGGPCALYDIEQDCNEHDNIAGRKPQIAARLLADLKHIDNAELSRLDNTVPRPIVLGRLGRQDIVNDLFALANSSSSPHAQEASKLLALYENADNKAALAKLLKSKNTLVAAWAAVGFALIDKANAPEPIMIDALKNNDDLGNWTAVALGLSGNKRALKKLIANLKIKDPLMRARSALALGELENAAAVPALIELLNIKQTRWAAIEALGMIGDHRAAAPLTKLIETEPDKSNLIRYERAIRKILDKTSKNR